MFGFLKRKRRVHDYKYDDKVPQYRYDVEIRFKDTHVFTIKDAEEVGYYETWNWIVAKDGDVKKHIHTDDAEEVTITRREINERTTARD